MAIVTLEQRSPEWLAWRKNGIGSSDVATIAGMNKYKTAYQLWEEMMGFRDGTFLNSAMKRGNDYEDDAREWIEDLMDLPVCPPVCFEDDEYPFMHASLDGYCIESGLILEIKVPTESTYASLNINKYLDTYYCQIQWQLMVTKSTQAIFVVYSPELQMGETVEVVADPIFIENIRAKAVTFWNDYKNGIPPKLSTKDYDDIKDDELEPLCDRYAEIKDRIDEKKKEIAPDEAELKKLKEQILDLGNDGNFTAYRLTCTRVAPRPYYDLEAMEADGIDISRYKRTKNEIGHYTVRVSKAKNERLE